jgi:hypothetical protein
MEKMFNATLIANKAEAFVDEETSDSPGRHTVSSDARARPGTIPGAPRPLVSGRMKPEELGNPPRLGQKSWASVGVRES